MYMYLSGSQYVHAQVYDVIIINQHFESYSNSNH